MLTCPHCQETIEIRILPHHGLFKAYRTCPTCAGTFEVDPQTKRRQALFIVLLLISLAATLLLYVQGPTWLLLACATYLLLAGLIYWGNKRVYLVPTDAKHRQTTR